MATGQTIPQDFECGQHRCEPGFIRVIGTGELPYESRYAYAADCAIYHAPRNLKALSYDALTGLKYQLSDRERRLRHQNRRCEVTEAFAKRLWAELPTRPEYQRAFGGAVRQREAA